MKINAANNMFQAQYTLNRFLITLVGFIVIAFSGSAYSETKKASKSLAPAVAKEMQALTPEYKSELVNRFYASFKESTKDDEWTNALSDDSKDIFLSCLSKRMTNTLWDSAAFKEKRSFEAINNQEAIKSNFDYCQLLVIANDELNKQTQKSKPSSSMAFNDLYVDYNGLKGSTVRVKGFLIASGDSNIITEGRGKFTAIFVDMTSLPREERKRVLDQCASGCDMELEGIVKDVMFQKGLTATKLY